MIFWSITAAWLKLFVTCSLCFYNVAKLQVAFVIKIFIVENPGLHTI